MDFAITEEQKILKKSAQDFLKKECPREKIREIMEGEIGHSEELWRKIAELGWLGLAFPSHLGGSDFTFTDLCILMEELGYHLFPGPFFSTVLLGAMPILSHGTESQKREILPKVASGDLILTLALTDRDPAPEAPAIETRARPRGSAYVLEGTKLFVSDAHLAHRILCVARTRKARDKEDGVTLFMVDAKDPAVQVTPLRTLSRDKQCEVVFRGARVPREAILGEPHAGWPIVQETLAKANVALSAKMLGGAQAVMDMALHYVKERIQFDRPIGSFQAVQHYFADMWIQINGARLLTLKAASSISKGVVSAKEVAMAKAKAAGAFRRATIVGHQVFGAIGFTYEHDMHLYHRRSISYDMAFGDGAFQRQRVARELGL